MNYICLYLIIHLNMASPSTQRASLVAQCERAHVRCRRPGLIPGSGISPGVENSKPVQYSCLGNPMDRGAWQATVHGIAKDSDTIWWLKNNSVLPFRGQTRHLYCWFLFISVSSFQLIASKASPTVDMASCVLPGWSASCPWLFNCHSFSRSHSKITSQDSLPWSLLREPSLIPVLNLGQMK